MNNISAVSNLPQPMEVESHEVMKKFLSQSAHWVSTNDMTSSDHLIVYRLDNDVVPQVVIDELMKNPLRELTLVASHKILRAFREIAHHASNVNLVVMTESEEELKDIIAWVKSLNKPLNSLDITSTKTRQVQLLSDIICATPKVSLDCDELLGPILIKKITSKGNTVFTLYGAMAQYFIEKSEAPVGFHVSCFRDPNFFLEMKRIEWGHVGFDVILPVNVKQLIFPTLLVTLKLENCLIEHEGAKALSLSLRQNRSLRVLSLSQNPIGDRGVEHIADLFKCGMAIEELFLDTVSTGERIENGANALFTVLTKSPNVVRLLSLDSLDVNGISILANSSLFSFIETTRTLTKFILFSCLVGKNFSEAENRLGEEVIQQFYLKLKKNRSLRYLKLEVGIDENPRLKAGLRDALTHNQTLYNAYIYIERVFQTGEFIGYIPLYNETDTHLVPNFRERQLLRWKTLHNLALLRFLRANKTHPLRASVYPILMQVLEKVVFEEFNQYEYEENRLNFQLQDKRDFKLVITDRRFEDTRYCRAGINYSS